MKIGVLAVQGAFIEHERVLAELGADYVELRSAADAEQSLDGLILPGGESTVQGKLLQDSGMQAVLKKRIEEGLPVLATCAGMILLAQELAEGEACHLGTMPIKVKRNAYGRQLGSFHTWGIMRDAGKIPMTFIRAPYVVSAAKGAEVLARVEGRIVAVRWGRQLALSFHPELDEDRSVHRLFLAMVREYLAAQAAGCSA